MLIELNKLLYGQRGHPLFVKALRNSGAEGADLGSVWSFPHLIVSQKQR